MVDESSTDEEAGARGRPVHQPSEENRRIVVAMCITRASKRAIARRLDIDLKTLDKYYGEELEDGVQIFEGELTRALMEQAIGAPAVFDEDKNLIRAEVKRVPRIGEFMARVHLGWNEKFPLSGKKFGPARTDTKTDAKTEKAAPEGKKEARQTAAAAVARSAWGGDLHAPDSSKAKN